MDLKKFLETNKQLNIRSFGEFMRQRRLEIGYSVRELAALLKVTPAYVSDIEKGNRHAPKTLLNEIIKILEISKEDEKDFIDLAYLSHETCAPDLILYLLATKEARQAVRYLIENNISGEEFLEMVESYNKNL